VELSPYDLTRGRITFRLRWPPTTRIRWKFAHQWNPCVNGAAWSSGTGAPWSSAPIRATSSAKA